MLRKNKKITPKSTANKKFGLSAKKEFRSKYFKTVEDFNDRVLFTSYFRFKKDCYWIISAREDEESAYNNNMCIRCVEYKNKSIAQAIKSFGLDKENFSHEEWNDVIGKSIHFILESSSMFKKI